MYNYRGSRYSLLGAGAMIKLDPFKVNPNDKTLIEQEQARLERWYVT
jgi:hypothetical protein